jgi:hypothetical protein
MLIKKLLLELVWWITTAVIIVVVMFPIWKDYPQFPFQTMNIVYILCFVTFTRYAFLLKHTFLAYLEKTKIAIVLFTLAIVGILTIQIQDFNVWYDNGDPDQLLYTVKQTKRESLLTYIKSEYLFFAIGSIPAAIVLSGRLLVSIWRLRNRNKV